MPDDAPEGAPPPPSATDTGVPSLEEIALALAGRILFPETAPLTRASAQNVAPDLVPDLAPEAAYLAAAAEALVESPGDAVARAIARPGPQDTALVALARSLSLTPGEIVALALTLAVETEMMAGRAVAYLQAPVGDARPSLGLLARLLAPILPGRGVPARLMAGAGVRAGLWEVVGDGPLPERALRLPDPLVAALTGLDPACPGLTLVADAPDDDWPDSHVAALRPLIAGLCRTPGALAVIRGAQTLDRREIHRRLATAAGRRPALIRLDGETPEIPRSIGPLIVAARLLPGFVVETGAGTYRPLPGLPGYDGPVVAYLGPEGQTGRDDLSAVEWRLPLPTPEERTGLWRRVAPDALARRIGTEHLQSAGRIREIAAASLAAARLSGRDQPDDAALADAFWAAEGEGLGALAQPVRDRVPDEAMVAAPALTRDLEALLARCRRRERLTDGLGPALAARYKLGVRALFTGPSGTGKTLGAAWLAGRLTLPLYRVDLASVISKYIGETEKNLARLLARAEEQEVVLLFDEADALFGKRTEISDANDRFANAQTNYLLQRIETYTGIVLLTSNARNRFDEAFTRRLDLIIDFQMPQPAERLALWQAHLGQGHAVGAGDIGRLAAMAELAGGHIRNAVLMAAVLAGEAGRPIGFDDLLAGLAAEYRKLGWTVPAELRAPPRR